MSDVTEILAKIESGDSAATDQLLPVVYQQLRDLARSKLRHERPDHTLQATALVHEAYLRLIGNRSQDDCPWDSRGHFFAAAAEAMRRILIESIRQKKSLKRGGDLERIELNSAVLDTELPDERLLALDSALDRLQELDPVKANVVKLRIFSGLTKAETAKTLDISARTVDRYWNFARAWLISEMSDG
ncbi:MAG: sigma-70 family RNA polymerase sigma factor [Planctomycetales bacterium]|nr:sigma-70 family RNA polymerase sigma factor [Planctomycetales bacterium]